MSDYQIDLTGPHVAVLRGVFRLASPEDYDRLFAPMTVAMRATTTAYTVDLSNCTLMNSSGVRGLADLVLLARKTGTPLTFLGRADVPWHNKTVASLKPLYAGLAVELS